jgi:3alpha(or 20beta)-hydroxysteroid dehydrogenase
MDWQERRMNRVLDKVAVISGGARGMGAEEAKLFAAEGAKVILGDLRDDEGEARAKALGENVKFVHLDVTNQDDWENAVKFAEQEFGRINILVNNAGITNYGAFEEYSLEMFKQVIDVNLFGGFNGMKAVAASMKASGGGSIVNISSVAGITGYPFVMGYTASKWAVRGMSKSAALELGKYNIRVNSIYPGQIRTPMSADGEGLKTSHIALKRIGGQIEVAMAVLFLASDESSFITGTELIVDGGEMAGQANWGESEIVSQK